HGPGILGVAPERFVTQHGPTPLDRHANVLEVHERWRVDRHQVNLIAQLGDRVDLARGHDVNHLASLRSPEGCADSLAEPAPDDPNSHFSLHTPDVPQYMRLADGGRQG